MRTIGHTFKKLPSSVSAADNMLFHEGSRQFKKCRRALGWSMFMLLVSIVLIGVGGFVVFCKGELPIFAINSTIAALVLWGGAGLNFISLLCIADAKWRLTFACQMLNMRAHLRYY